MIQRHEDIARRAFEIWEKEGRPEGKSWDHWIRAEKLVREENGGDGQNAEQKSRERTTRARTTRKTPKGENL